MSWNEKLHLGAVKCPAPTRIRPGLSSVNISLRGVVNPGTFQEGETVVIRDYGVYTQLVSDPLWEEAPIPTKYLETSNGNGK